MGIRIVVCDDEKCVHEQIAKLSKEYAETSKLTLHSCYSISELLNYQEKYDAILMDVNLADGNGIEAIEHLPKMGRDKKIIMLTASRENYKDAFKIGAVRDVTKPIDKDKLFEAFDYLLFSLSDCTLKVYSEGKMMNIPQKKVVFIESKVDYRKVFTDDMVFDSRKTMKELEQILDSNFFIKVHKSYFVNMIYISKVEKDGLLMKNGIKIPVARRLHSDVMEAIVLFDRGVKR